MKRAISLLLLLPAVACASAQAKSPVARPDLDVPAPPPRVIEAAPAPPPASASEPVGELPAAAPAPPRSRPQPPPTREPARTEPKPEQASPPVDPPVVTPPPQLRTPGTADTAEVTRQIRDILERAKKTLGSIDYRRLSTARRSQYDTARLMIGQSEDALKGANFEIARNLADKADRIAKELQTR